MSISIFHYAAFWKMFAHFFPPFFCVSNNAKYIFFFLDFFHRIGKRGIALQKYAAPNFNRLNDMVKKYIFMNGKNLQNRSANNNEYLFNVRFDEHNFLADAAEIFGR